MPREFKTLIVKTKYLEMLELEGNRASKTTLERALKALQQDKSFAEMRSTFFKARSAELTSEIQHLETDWYNKTTTWYPGVETEAIIRRGMIEVFRLRIKHGKAGRNGKPLPVNYWWVPNASAFAVVPLYGKHQLTVMFMTPRPP